MPDKIIGFVGLGRMGGPMAGRLLDAGYSLSVFDTQAEATKPLVARGARLAKSPAEVASSSDIVLASLPTPDVVKAVALGADGIVKGNRAKILIDLSTSGPGAAKLVAAGLAPNNITLVDAPVSGGIKGAVNGTLAVMVSCPKDTFAEVEPILKHFGKIFFTGELPGLAQTAKLANNLMAAAALVITSEAVAMGVKGGVNAKVLIDIFNASSGRNSATEDKFPRAVLPGTYDFGSRPASPTRTCGCASTKPRRWAFRWFAARRFDRCWPSPTRSSAPRPTSRRSPRFWKNGPACKCAADRRRHRGWASAT